MLRSLARTLTLPDETLVLPGHGPQTTIGAERRVEPVPGRSAGLPRRGFSIMTFQAPKGVYEYVPPRSALFAGGARRRSPNPRAGPATATWRRRSSRTPRCSCAASASPPTSCTKEMYSFQDRGGGDITLRPEVTAGVLRAVLEHNLHKGALPVKL